jgi:ATP-dependent RNA circularization protein (DNA/RNA ligase family)
MSELKSYAKVYQLGHRETLGMFGEPVLVEEKIDGSQFSFGVDVNGNIQCRSRGQSQYPNGDKMFDLAVEQVRAMIFDMKCGWTYRGEYMSKPKHNTLCYDRIPANHIMIFDIDRGDNDYLTYEEKKAEAERLGFEVVPLIFEGTFDTKQDMLKLLDRQSVLGGTKIEGMVFKQYNMLDCSGNVVMAKYVSEAFKEKHVKDWKGRNPGQKDVLETIIESLRQPARWQKALQHLKERGGHTGEPKDIGPLVAEVQADTFEEELEWIAQRLLKWAVPHIKRGIVRGLPEWYKELLAQKAFEGEEDAVH